MNTKREFSNRNLEGFERDGIKKMCKYQSKIMQQNLSANEWIILFCYKSKPILLT